VEKSSDATLLRDMISFAAQCPFTSPPSKGEGAKAKGAPQSPVDISILDLTNFLFGSTMCDRINDRGTALMLQSTNTLANPLPLPDCPLRQPIGRVPDGLADSIHERAVAMVSLQRACIFTVFTRVGTFGWRMAGWQPHPRAPKFRR
jgi:hypothetical protein